MNENYLVTKANTLITSNYDLSLEEQRVILTLASTVQPTDEDFKPYKFSIKEFMELLGVESKSKYSVIPKITKDLMQKVLELKQDNKIIQVAWISSAVYEKGSGTVELEFSPKLKPFMLGLKEFYTSYRLKNVLELKGKYSIRMYEILKSNEFKKVVEIEIDELRKILKADTGSYLIYQNFRNRIILQAQKELNEKTDISFKFEEIKTSRKVTRLKFHIKSNRKAIDEVSATLNTEVNPNKNESSADEINAIKTIFKSALGFNVSDEFVKGIYNRAVKNKQFGNKPLELIKEVAEYSKTQNITKNFAGWFKNTVLSYERPIKTFKKDSFNDFEQRNYDFDELEKRLLGWDDPKYDEIEEHFQQEKLDI